MFYQHWERSPPCLKRPNKMMFLCRQKVSQSMSSFWWPMRTLLSVQARAQQRQRASGTAKVAETQPNSSQCSTCSPEPVTHRCSSALLCSHSFSSYHTHSASVSFLLYILWGCKSLSCSVFFPPLTFLLCLFLSLFQKWGPKPVLFLSLCQALIWFTATCGPKSITLSSVGEKNQLAH